MQPVTQLVRTPVSSAYRPEPAPHASRFSAQPARGGAPPGVAPATAPGAGDEVLQGEVITRQRAHRYQSTQSYLQEREFERAKSAQQAAGPGFQPRRALSHYLQHTGPETANRPAGERSVDIRV